MHSNNEIGTMLNLDKAAELCKQYSAYFHSDTVQSIGYFPFDVQKTKLHFFKFVCVVCLLIFYYSIYLWATNNWGLLPLMQKLNFINSTLLILGLEYFTKQQDFAHIKTRRQKKPADKPFRGLSAGKLTSNTA